MLAMIDEHRVGTDRGTPLSRDISFWGMSITQFLGAFNDNLYKQLMLLLIAHFTNVPSPRKQSLEEQ